MDLEDLRSDVKREIKMADIDPEAPYGLVAVGAPLNTSCFPDISSMPKSYFIKLVRST